VHLLLGLSNRNSTFITGWFAKKKMHQMVCKNKMHQKKVVICNCNKSATMVTNMSHSHNQTTYTDICTYKVKC